jgi:hypothetical protein
MVRHISRADLRGKTIAALIAYIQSHADDPDLHNVKKAIEVLQERRSNGEGDKLADENLVDTVATELGV